MAEEMPAGNGRVTQSPNPLNGCDGDNWRPLGSVIASLMAEVNAAIAARDEHAAAEAHAALIDAEHTQRVVETVRRCGR